MKRLALVFVILLLASGCAFHQKFTHIPGHPLEEYVAAYIERMLVSNGHSATEVKYCILLNPVQMNAIIYPDNVLVITTGLLDRCAKEAGEEVFAAILAHELAHYKLNHTRSQQMFTMRAWWTSRSQELDADRMSVEILKNAGWSDAPNMCIKALTWFSGFSSSPGFFLWSSHPRYDDRIANIRETFGQNP